MTGRKTVFTVRACNHVKVTHQHGTASAYKQDGCRCRPCTTASVDSDRLRRKQIAYGRWECWVDSTGTVRRLQALTAAGWSSSELGEQLGIAPWSVNKLRLMATNQGRVTRTTRDRVTYIYDRLWHTTPTGRYQARSERHAARMGWAAPWQWEGLDIDNPDTQPAPPAVEGLDEIAVERIMAGTLASQPRSREREEAIRRLFDLGYPDPVIGQRVGMTSSNVGWFRQRHGITRGVAA